MDAVERTCRRGLTKPESRPEKNVITKGGGKGRET